MCGLRRGPRITLAIAGLALLLSPGSTSSATPEPGTSAYRDVLRRYALGDDLEALRRLQQLDTSGGATRLELERTRSQRLVLLEQLFPAEPDLLLPVFCLHEETYLAQLDQDLQATALHSRTTMFLLSELYAEHATTQEHRERAADLFAILGGYAQGSSSDRAAIELFRRAIELDLNNEAGLLGAAAASERHGRYASALRYLEQLYRVHPDNLEGRLRLALNLKRNDRETEAMTLMRQVLHTDAPPWVLSLAYQTVADWLLAAHDLEQAEAVLREGLDRFPNDPTLPLAMTYVAERRHPAQPADDLDAALHAIADSPLVSPRLRYALDPVEVVERSRARLRARADASRGLLAAALARAPAAAPEEE